MKPGDAVLFHGVRGKLIRAHAKVGAVEIPGKGAVMCALSELEEIKDDEPPKAKR